MIQGVKSKDFVDEGGGTLGDLGTPPSPFCTVAKMMKEGKHLTKKGLEQDPTYVETPLRIIKGGMNTGRKSD